MRDFTEVRKQIERLTRTISEHPTYEEQLAYFVNALSISSYLLGILEGEDMAQEWRRANDCTVERKTNSCHRP